MADGGDESGNDVRDEPLLSRVPGWVVPLGAGSLFTATLVTFAGFLFVAYGLATGTYFGFQPYELQLAAFQFVLATAAQAAGVYFALGRVRWTFVMVATVLGALAFITVPFSAIAFVCLGLGKYHFASFTPASLVGGE